LRPREKQQHSDAAGIFEGLGRAFKPIVRQGHFDGEISKRETRKVCEPDDQTMEQQSVTKKLHQFKNFRY
jgi:hypothetical protein